MISHICKTCARSNNQPCYYLNIKRLKEEKRESCPYWAPKSNGKNEFFQEVIRKLEMWKWRN